MEAEGIFSDLLGIESNVKNGRPSIIYLATAFKYVLVVIISFEVQSRVVLQSAFLLSLL